MTDRNYFNKFFNAGLVIKGIDGLFETAGAVLLFVFSKAALAGFVIDLTQHELSEDPNDLIANTVRSIVLNLSSNTKIFAAAYLLVHGVIKIFLAFQLLNKKIRFYPAAIAFLIVFTLYQIYRLAVHWSPGLLLLTIFDVVIIVLVAVEYRRLQTLRG